ncbi:MAG: kelch-like protein, partial [Acidobacteria bacterium]|nr:kelch-like protein [Acidobacteriota bacterium]
VLLADGKILVVGGSDERDFRGGIYSSAELYEPATGKFAATSSMSTARFKIPDVVVLLQNGKALIAGGGQRLDVYDPATASFSQAAGGVDRPRQFAAATLLENGKVLITGGYDENAGPATAAAWLYKP